MSTTTHSFEESKIYCSKINGSIVSSVLGSIGKEYHGYDSLSFFLIDHNIEFLKTNLKCHKNCSKHV